MKSACLVYHEEKPLAAVSESKLASIVAECGVWVEELTKGGQHVFSAGLQSVRAARTVRNRNGKLSFSNGPFAETKEFLGGFTITLIWVNVNSSERVLDFKHPSKS